MRQINLDCLEKDKYDKIKWAESIGKTLSFIYEDITGEVEIIDYDKKESKMLVKYKDNEQWIGCTQLKQCGLGNLIGYKKINKYKYEVGQTITTSKKSITILDREIRERKRIKDNKEIIIKVRFYKIICNNCKQIKWIAEKEIGKDTRCNACEKFYTKRGINDIVTLRPDLLEYFDDPEIAKQATLHSNKITGFHCPKCLDHKEMRIGDFVERGYNCVNCDNVGGSYPEKLFKEFLNQLDVNFIMQLTHTIFEWVGSYRYDFYLTEYNTIVETHGKQHYEETSYTDKTLAEEQENDRLKEELARQNNIDNYIVIDCRRSELNWIKNSIMNSCLPELLNFNENDIDWELCHINATKSNIMEDVCKYWKDNNVDDYLPIKDIVEEFGLSRAAIYKYLTNGAKLGLCNYDPQVTFHKSKIQPKIKDKDIRKVSEYWEKHYHEDITTKTVGDVLGLQQSVVESYLKKGTILGYCNYDPKKELSKTALKNSKKCCKKTNVYDKNLKYCYTFSSSTEAAKELTNIYNKDFNNSKISAVCNRTRNHHRGFIFRYDEDDELKDLQNNTTNNTTNNQN